MDHYHYNYDDYYYWSRSDGKLQCDDDDDGNVMNVMNGIPKRLVTWWWSKDPPPPLHHPVDNGCHNQPWRGPSAVAGNAAAAAADGR